MPRKRRSEAVVGGLPHHVILRGNNRRNLFAFDDERLLFLRLLADALAKTGASLHALSLLRNHVHAIITPPSAAALGSCMHRATHRYALRRNQATGGSGKLFEERYKAVPIGDDAYLAVCTLYVDLNPEFAGTPARARAWSTLALHAGDPARARVPVELWTPSLWYEALGADPAERAARYRAAADEYRAVRAATALLDGEDVRDTRRLERPDRSTAR